jgi:hypothetical protein
MRATQSSHKTIQDVVSAKKERIVGTKSLFRTGVDVKEDRGAFNTSKALTSPGGVDPESPSNKDEGHFQSN